MLHKLEENNDWRSKYQAALNQLETRELEWERIEKLLRKTIGRLAIAGRGLDNRLDRQLRLIQELSRDKRDQKLAEALEQLSVIVSALEDAPSDDKPRRSDPILLMLELLQNVHFDQAQRGQLKEICSELLISVAKGHDRDSVSIYIQKLSALINENFDDLDADGRTVEVLFQLLDLLGLDDDSSRQFRVTLSEVRQIQQRELQQLADLINAQQGSGRPGASIDDVISNGSCPVGLNRPKITSSTAASLAPKLASSPALRAAISGRTAGRSRYTSTMVGTASRRPRMRSFSGLLKSRSP